MDTMRVLAAVALVAIIITAGTVTGLFLIPKYHSTGSASSSSSLSSFSSSTTGSGLDLVSAGTALSSNLTVRQSRTPIVVDETGLYYYDWEISGLADLQPDVAWFSANASGLTFSDQTCDGPQPVDCGPYETWNSQQASNFTELGAGLFYVPADLEIFSIYVNIPYYPFLGLCTFSTNHEGCSYEGSEAMVGANFQMYVSSPNRTDYVSISIAEVPSGNNSNSNHSISAVSYLFGANTEVVNCNIEGCSNSGIILLNSTLAVESSGSSFHKLTIATDRKSFIDLLIDNACIYCSNSLPVSLSGSSLGIEFNQFTSVNNETSSTTWRNFTAYSVPEVFVAGLTQGMVAVVTGPLEFRATALPNSTGVATVDVLLSPSDLSVSVEENDSTITTFPSTVNAGATLDLLLSPTLP